jgi:hypothetical protein
MPLNPLLDLRLLLRRETVREFLRGSTPALEPFLAD